MLEYTDLKYYLYCLTIFVMHFIMQITVTPAAYAGEHSTDNLPTVDITYFHDFPGQKKTTQHNAPECYTPECFVLLNPSPVAGLPALPVLRCKERIRLLRSHAVIQHWKKIQAQNGFIKFNLPEFGINHVKATVTEAISPPVNKTPSSVLRYMHTDIITGTFISHTANVKKYHFKEEKTGRTVSINVTDNHRFYVKNKHTFIPIKEISPNDQMITATGNGIRLLCAKNKLHDCGQPYNAGQITTVYNVETGHQHMYFAGDTAILAHNDCIRIQAKLYDNRGRMEYEGEINMVTRKTDGWGTYYYSNNRKKYVGDSREGLYHGSGKCYQNNERNTMLHDGKYVKGQRDGLGYGYTDEGKPLYAGMYKNGRYAGQGTLYHSNGKPRYSGTFENHNAHGLGISFHDNGCKDYQGLWANGQPEDTAGIQFWGTPDKENIMRHRGGWLQGVKSGHGIQFDDEGNPKIEGEWAEGHLVQKRLLTQY